MLARSSKVKEKSYGLWEELLGRQLITQQGPKRMVDVLTGATAVGLYFTVESSAQCQEFNTELSNAYKSKLAKKGFETILVSSCEDEKKHDEFYKTMPWSALPFGDKETKARLRKEFSIRDKDLPMLVVLNTKAQLITRKGLECVKTDIKAYPWTQKSPLTVMPKSFMQRNNQTNKIGEIGAKAALKGKNVGLYFADSRSPKCEEFLPALVQMYAKVRQSDPSFQVIFVSSDETKEAFDRHYDKMPWLAIFFDDREAEARLASVCDVVEVPTFVVLDETGKVISRM